MGDVQWGKLTLSLSDYHIDAALKGRVHQGKRCL